VLTSRVRSRLSQGRARGQGAKPTYRFASPADAKSIGSSVERPSEEFEDLLWLPRDLDLRLRCRAPEFHPKALAAHLDRRGFVADLHEHRQRGEVCNIDPVEENPYGHHEPLRTKGEFWGYPESRAFAELLIDCEEDRTLRAVLVGMLRETNR
jgi:hypothetical protein